MLGLVASIFSRASRADVDRLEFFARAAEFTSHVSVEAGGFVFLVATDDAQAGGSFFQTRDASELVVLPRVCELVEPRGVFVDVGAHIGTTTVPAAVRFERVLAVEAEPRNVTLLRANVALNKMDARVVVQEVACAAAEDVVELRLSEKYGGHALGPAKPGQPSIRVRAAPLDTIVTESGLTPEEIGLVWIGASKGVEAEVLRGAPALVAARVPFVAEVRARNAAEVLQIVDGGYSSAIDLREEVTIPVSGLPDRLAEIASRGGRKFSDFLFLPST